ncbi:hypothetical protein B0H21DRAFT_826190 [Amylocystis lapponica]|nr:hypothetical protein B0H21DRAFT_826190 [Amylocystis lapponica]
MSYFYPNLVKGDWLPITEAETYVHKMWWMAFHPNFFNPTDNYYLGPITKATDGELIDENGKITDVGFEYLVQKPAPEVIPSFEEMCIELGIPALDREDADGAWLAQTWREIILCAEADLILAEIAQGQSEGFRPIESDSHRVADWLVPKFDAQSAPVTIAQAPAEAQAETQGKPQEKPADETPSPRRSARLAMRVTKAAALAEQS